MHPYVIDAMVQERQHELLRQRTAAGRGRDDVAGWRRRTGRALGSLAVALAVPRGQRTVTRRQVGAALCLER